MFDMQIPLNTVDFEKSCVLHKYHKRFTIACQIVSICYIIPSLTLVKSKSGYRPSNYAVCSHFLFGNDLCYFFPSSVLVLFIMLRMADFEINS